MMQENISVSYILNVISKVGLLAECINESPDEWDAVLENCEYVPVMYLSSFINYQAEYMTGAVDEHLDMSLIIYHDRKPVAVWPLCIYRRKSVWKLGSNAGQICSPLFIKDLAEKTQKKVIDKCLSIIEILSRNIGQMSWQSTEVIDAKGAGLWHRKIMDKGASITVSHELYVDLSKSLEEIRNNIRKSYKSLLTLGDRLWRIDVIDQDNPKVFNEFRELHYRVAGRVTRSLSTWKLQEEAIAQKQAFLITLRDEQGNLVGGGLFYISASEGLYAVAAYNRELFDKPLGHIVQMRAIETMKKLGIRWYKIGARPYAGDVLEPTLKELSIGKFKEGFATHVYFCTQLDCPVK